MNAILNKRILDCVVENGILPNASSSWANEESQISHPPSSGTKVFIASLYRGLRDYLKGVYPEARPVSGEDVEVIQVSGVVPLPSASVVSSLVCTLDSDARSVSDRLLGCGGFLGYSPALCCVGPVSWPVIVCLRRVLLTCLCLNLSLIVWNRSDCIHAVHWSVFGLLRRWRTGVKFWNGDLRALKG